MRRFVNAIVVFAIAFIFASVPTTVQAQELTSLSVGSGESPMVSGLSIIATFSTDNNRYIETAMMNDMAWAAYGLEFDGKVDGFAAVSIGHLFKEPWVGPYFYLGTDIGEVRISTMQWPAFFIRVPERFETDAWTGHLGNVSASYRSVTLSYALNKFLDEPWNQLPGVSVNLPLPENISFTVSGTWNTNNEKLMLFFGSTWEPPQ